MEIKCCGTCKWHEYESAKEDWVCCNEESDLYGCYADYKDVCPEWEERE